jgi:L-fuculose-phosphate aldolase
MSEQYSLAAKVALACRIVFMEGQDDFSLGHISALDEEGLIWMKPSGLGLEEVREEDIIVLNLKGEVVKGARKPHNETPIHTEIYRARPDVKCVIHTHPFHAIAFSALEKPWAVLSHDGVPLAGEIAYFTETPDLITTEEGGRSLARCLGAKRVALMKNHGVVVAAESVEAATCWALHLEKAARMQLLAGPHAQGIAFEKAVAMRKSFESVSGRYPGFFAYEVRKLESKAF